MMQGLGFFSPCTREALGRAGPQSPGKEEEIAGGGGAESGDLVGKLLISTSGTQRSQKWKSGGSSSSSGRHPPVAVPSQSHQHLKPCSWSVPEANQGVLLRKADTLGSVHPQPSHKWRFGRGAEFLARAEHLAADPPGREKPMHTDTATALRTAWVRGAGIETGPSTPKQEQDPSNPAPPALPFLYPDGCGAGPPVTILGALGHCLAGNVAAQQQRAKPNAVTRGRGLNP